MGLVLYRNMSSEEWDNLEKGQTPILPSKDGNKEESMVADYFKRHNLPHPKRFVSIAFTVASRDIGEAMWAYGSIRVFLNPDTVLPDLIVASPIDIQNDVYNERNNNIYGVVKVQGDKKNREGILVDLCKKRNEHLYSEARLYRPLEKRDILRTEEKEDDWISNLQKMS